MTKINNDFGWTQACSEHIRRNTTICRQIARLWVNAMPSLPSTRWIYSFILDLIRKWSSKKSKIETIGSMHGNGPMHKNKTATQHKTEVHMHCANWRTHSTLALPFENANKKSQLSTAHIVHHQFIAQAQESRMRGFYSQRGRRARAYTHSVRMTIFFFKMINQRLTGTAKSPSTHRRCEGRERERKRERASIEHSMLFAIRLVVSYISS